MVVFAEEGFWTEGVSPRIRGGNGRALKALQGEVPVFRLECGDVSGETSQAIKILMKGTNR